MCILSLFGDEFSSIEESVQGLGIEPEECAKIVNYVEHVEIVRETKLLNLMEMELGIDKSTGVQIINKLSKARMIYRSYLSNKNTNFIISLDNETIELCRNRRISSARYIQMRPVLREFQEEVEEYFSNRKKRFPRTAISETKREYIRILAKIWFDEEPEEGKEFHHIAAKYIKTAQDEIQRRKQLYYS